MTEDYLWDGSGEPDPEIAQLEAVLERYRWSGKKLYFPNIKPVSRVSERRAWLMAAAAAVVFGVGMMFLIHRTREIPRATSWQLSQGNQKPQPVRSGQVIETGREHSTIESESVGEVVIDPDSRLRLLATTHQDEHRLALDHGTIHAFIWAPPRRFVIDTPAAKTVDLGCRYTLSVAKDGSGFLVVELGWVAFEWNKVESFIPRGAACATRVGHGPGTPYFLDAPAALTKSLSEFDVAGNGQALDAVLRAARPRDALTLWHLLERTQDGERGEVFDRLAELVSLPASVTKEGIRRGDGNDMNAAWDALKLGDTSWWREWKRDW